MTTYFVTRHPGAREWARRHGLAIDHFVAHLDVEAIRPGDTVAGTLPVHIAAAVCKRGAQYFHLRLDLPAHLRGADLRASDMDACNARLEAYRILDGSFVSSPVLGEKSIFGESHLLPRAESPRVENIAVDAVSNSLPGPVPDRGASVRGENVMMLCRTQDGEGALHLEPMASQVLRAACRSGGALAGSLAGSVGGTIAGFATAGPVGAALGFGGGFTVGAAAGYRAGGRLAEWAI